MSNSGTVGLFIAGNEEREICRDAVLNCGLGPLEIGRTTYEAALAGQKAPGDVALQFIVTDAKAVLERYPTTDGADSSRGHSPLLVLVRDGDQAQEQDAAGAWVLRRPLEMESVSSQLRQILHAARAFELQHHLMMEELHRSRRIFDSVCNGITICDASLPDLPLIYVNPAFVRMTGYSAEETCGQNCRFLQGANSDQPALTKVREAILEQHDVRVLLKNYRKDGTLFWNELYMSPISDLDGNLTHFVGIQNDVTAQVEAQLRLDHLAYHDALTGLANRGLMMEQLRQALHRAFRKGGKVAVLFFDLDNFKQVNDVLGHDAGDELLKIVADRLRSLTRANEIVARLGGDEFIVVLEDISADWRPDEVMQRLHSSLTEPAILAGNQVYPSASVGMAVFPQDGDTPEALLKVADFNMYLAKHEARASRESGATLRNKVSTEAKNNR